MKKNLIHTLWVLLLLLSVFLPFSCKKSDNTTMNSSSGVLVKLVTSSTLGQYLVDQNGVALYFYSNDYLGHNSCSGGCAAYWPYFSPGTLTQSNLGTGLNLADFDTIHVGSVIQARYKGWPLYYYSPTGNGVVEASGGTTGEGVDGTWYTAKPDYTIMIANGQLKGSDGNNYTGTYTVGTGPTMYFTDSKGMTLYTFSVDSFNTNKFTKADFSNNSSWPVYDTTIAVVPSTLDKTKFSSITVAGHKQLTYNGWPLYYFGGDQGVRGNNKGVSIGAPGKWPVAVKAISSAPIPVAPKSYSVKLGTSGTFGQYIVDKHGVTLYFFSNDYKGLNSCSGGCGAYWPSFYAGSLTQDSLGAGLKITDFDTIHVGSVVQTRYKGWPLYYYSPGGNSTPEAAGQTAGDGVNGVWFIAKPNYSIMLSNGQLVGMDGNMYTPTYTVGSGKTTYFTDTKGVTLYTFTVDSFNINKFTKADFSNNAAWPIYDTTQVVVPSILDKTKFSTIMVAGHNQLTYNGWPLYYFGQDMNVRGNTKGVSVGGPGKWPVAVQNISSAPKH